MLEAARTAGAKRFIHISTESVLWRGQHLRGVDETYPRAPNSPYPYSWTKAHAEELVENANTADFQTIILRPRFIWGPGDTTLLPVIEHMAKTGQWQWINDGKAKTSTTHITNLVHAIELALTKGNGGQAYFILDDGTRTMKEIISAIAATRGITLPEKSVPSWTADALAGVAEGAWRILKLKGQPPVTRFGAMIMSRDSVLIDAKARREMGYAPVISVAEGLQQLRG
jgi:nucleoside-diphosphate-sugar epimerase